MTTTKNAERIAKLARKDAEQMYGNLRGYISDDVWERLVMGSVALAIGQQELPKYDAARAIVDAALAQCPNTCRVVDATGSVIEKEDDQLRRERGEIFACMECGKKFRTISAAEKATSQGCPKCGGCDIDLHVDVERARKARDEAEAKS